MLEAEPKNPESFSREKRDALKALLMGKIGDDMETTAPAIAYDLFKEGNLTLEDIKQIHGALKEADLEMDAEWEGTPSAQRGISLAQEKGRYGMEAERLALFMKKSKIELE